MVLLNNNNERNSQKFRPLWFQNILEQYIHNKRIEEGEEEEEETHKITKWIVHFRTEKIEEKIKYKRKSQATWEIYKGILVQHCYKPFSSG